MGGHQAGDGRRAEALFVHPCLLSPAARLYFLHLLFIAHGFCLIPLSDQLSQPLAMHIRAHPSHGDGAGIICSHADGSRRGGLCVNRYRNDERGERQGNGQPKSHSGVHVKPPPGEDGPAGFQDGACTDDIRT